MERNTHPLVVVLAVIGALASVAVIGMIMTMTMGGTMSGMIGGMRMPGC